VGVLDRFRRTPEPVTAAAVRVLQPDQLPQRAVQTRESAEAWTAYRDLGEVGYATNQQARLVGRLDWTVTIGGGEPLDTDQSDALMRAAFGDNVDALADRAALMLQVPGGYVLARTNPGDAESWRVFSTPLSTRNRKIVERSDIVVQVRTEDPEDDFRNDSPVLRSMGTCRDLMLARAQSRASSRNRTAQHGLLLYPTDGVPNPQAFEDELQTVITAPLADERSSASVTPNIVGVPSDYVEKFKVLDLGGDYDEKLDAKIARLVRSLAVQLDIPPELLLGLGDSTHWNAWAIQEDNWAGHIEPMAKPVGQGFAAAIMQATGVEGVKIEPDPGPLMVRRPTVADTATAYQDGVVSGEYYREQLGADETDAPTPQEVQARAATQALPAPAAAEPPPVAAAAKAGPDPRALAAIDQQAYDAVEDLATDTADRCMERLGAKVRSMARGDASINPDIPNSRLAVNYATPIPNADTAISETITSALPRLDRVMDRAYSRLRSAGVDVTQDPDDAFSARALFTALVTDMVAVRMTDRPTIAAAWSAGRRVVAVAGGNTDPALVHGATG
jgi:hypothetical protein